MGKAALEIGIDGNIDRGADGGEMGQHILQRNAVVGPAERPGEARAGRGNRLEAEMRERFRRADIDGIGDHETAALVQLAEMDAFVSSCQRHRSLLCCFSSPRT
jgi:hypothetical protein